MANKKLPTGIQSFREIREEGMYYVDKTEFAKRLIDGDKHNFLSRPRRFGKSLFVDTLKHLFEGNKGLFKGLHIYDKWDWGVEYPVVRFSFGRGDFDRPGELEKNVLEQLAAIERREGLTTEAETASGRFAELLERLSDEKGQRVVILVDEYDKPIFGALETEEVARANRSYLRGFYGTIKDCEDYIKFSFLTGVSKFAHAGIFSGLNNLTDITLRPEFSSICGYTDHDIDTVFAPVLGDLDRDKIKEWYDGYNWRGDENVYNPYSILRLFSERELESWWFPTGTPSFLIEELKKRGGTGKLNLAKMRTANELLSSIDIGRIKTSALLFQTGYLTIAEKKKTGTGTLYRLDFPNLEVRESLHQELLEAVAPTVAAVVQPAELRDALVLGDFKTVRNILHSVFSNFPKEWYSTGNASSYESNYAVTMYNTFMATGLMVSAEDSTSEGRIDLTVETGTRIIIFELKVLKEGVAPGDAIQQIRDKNYADKYQFRGVPVHLIGVEFDRKERNIENFKIEPAWPADDA